MRINRSLQEELTAEPPDSDKDIVTISQETVTEQLTDQQVIRNILTHYVYYILLGAFILIFIGIYCVCKWVDAKIWCILLLICFVFVRIFLEFCTPYTIMWTNDGFAGTTRKGRKERRNASSRGKEDQERSRLRVTEKTLTSSFRTSSATNSDRGAWICPCRCHDYQKSEEKKLLTLRQK